jgi:hypothetical protein
MEDLREETRKLALRMQKVTINQPLHQFQTKLLDLPDHILVQILQFLRSDLMGEISIYSLCATNKRCGGLWQSIPVLRGGVEGRD